MHNASGHAANRVADLRMADGENIHRKRLRAQTDMPERYHTVKSAGVQGSPARRERLLAPGLQKVDEPLVVEGFERCERGASFGADAGDVAAKEQSDSGGRMEFPYAPGATGVVGDAANNDASERVIANAAAAVNSRRLPDSISRWSGWQHDLP